MRGKRSLGVVVAAYNAADLLDQTLASLAGQSQTADQIVGVDDASPDETAAVARRWQAVMPLCVVRQDVNRGVAHTRNVGLAKIDTDLVTFLDGDDVLLPDHLEVLANQWERERGIVSARALFWTPTRSLRPYQRRVRGFRPPRKNQLEQLLHRNFVFVASLVAAEAVQAVGGFSVGDRSHDTTADWDLWLRLVIAGQRVTLAPTPTVLYRVRAGSMAADGDWLLRCEIAQLERLQPLLPPHALPAAARAIEQRHAELSLLAALGQDKRTRRGASARLIVGGPHADWRHRVRALAYTLAPTRASKSLLRRGSW